MECELAIVGAGPAGMSAAMIAASLGLSTVVVDDGAVPGGQYYRHGPGRPPSGKVKAFLKLTQASPALTYLPRTTVWHLEPGFKLYLDGPSGTGILLARSVILATGAWERPVPFPGWDLAGVLTAGAIQLLLKAQGVIAGRPVVLAGGPFVLSVARDVLAAGGELAAVALAGRPSLRQTARLLASKGTVGGQAAMSLAAIARHRVPLYVGWLVREASGDEVLREVTLAKHDQDWRPIPGSEIKVRARVLGVSYGFVSATQLAQLAGCQMRWDPLRFQWLPQHNADLETTVSGLYVAGEAAGVAGVQVAEIEGRLAAICSFERLRGSGRPTAEARNRLQGQWEGARAWADRFVGLSAFGPGLYRLASASTTVCRCEGVRWSEVLDALSHGVADLNSLKVRTRVGMGPCQGRFCEPTLIPMVAQGLGIRPEDVRPFSIRPPAAPVEVGRLAGFEVWPKGPAEGTQEVVR